MDWQREQGLETWLTDVGGEVDDQRRETWVGNGAQLFVVHSQGLTALNSHTGSIQWKLDVDVDLRYATKHFVFGINNRRWVMITADGTRHATLDEREETNWSVESIFSEVDPGHFAYQNIERGALRIHRADGQLVTTLQLHTNEGPREFQAVANDWVMRTNRRLMRFDQQGHVLWEREIPEYSGQVLPDGDVLCLSHERAEDSPVKVQLINALNGSVRWTSNCPSGGVSFCTGWRVVYAENRGHALVVVNQSPSGNFIEVLDRRSGKRLFRHEP